MPTEFEAVFTTTEIEGYPFFVAFATHYPNVDTIGDTFAEVKEGIEEAFFAMLDECKALDKPVEYSARPWRDIPNDATVETISIAADDEDWGLDFGEWEDR